MNKWTELLVGLVLIVLPIVLSTLVWPNWWAASLVFLQGAIFWFVLGIGVLFVLLSIADLKDNK